MNPHSFSFPLFQGLFQQYVNCLSYFLGFNLGLLHNNLIDAIHITHLSSTKQEISAPTSILPDGRSVESILPHHNGRRYSFLISAAQFLPGIQYGLW